MAEPMDGLVDGHPAFGEPVEDEVDVRCPEHGRVKAKRVSLEPPLVSPYRLGSDGDRDFWRRSRCPDHPCGCRPSTHADELIGEE